MVSERAIRLTLTPLTTLSFLTSIVVLAIAASLESHWSDVGFPSNAARDRERLLLVAGIFGVIVSLYSLIGTFIKPGSVAFGIMFHLVAFAIAFFLYLCGSSSLTAYVDNRNCGIPSETFSRCNITKGLVAVGWIGTIWVFLILVFVFIIGLKARSGAGMRRGALTDA
ncbi:hypothetical protein DMC30DRAFT_285075 [Rhodotorula diobovata]|uniref:MARVEL domain-containing protein n=1 Tax=Rhodotorula diobovata TaxID=5288 RepID=A0A5C5FUB6_9BASI|nr:hypothetical protein DMC30DRAFT_285075 [Rhodotorula diobovata]